MTRVVTGGRPFNLCGYGTGTSIKKINGRVFNICFFGGGMV